MILNLGKRSGRRHRSGGFTLVDVMIGTAILVVMAVTFYIGFGQGFAVIQVARENLRATQILQEKMETVRLYTWEQLNTAGFVPANFMAPFYPAGGGEGSGVVYNGTVTISPAPLSESYSDNMKLVVARLNWRSGSTTRYREMRTLVSRYGLHNYIY